MAVWIFCNLQAIHTAKIIYTYYLKKYLVLLLFPFIFKDFIRIINAYFRSSFPFRRSS